MKLSTEVIVRTPENFPRMKISSTVCCRFSPLDRATVEIHLPRSTFHSFAIFVPNVTEAFPESSTAFPARHGSPTFLSRNDKSILLLAHELSRAEIPSQMEVAFLFCSHRWKQHPKFRTRDAIPAMEGDFFLPRVCLVAFLSFSSRLNYA